MKHTARRWFSLLLVTLLPALGLLACKSSPEHPAGSDHPEKSEHPEHPK